MAFSKAFLFGFDLSHACRYEQAPGYAINYSHLINSGVTQLLCKHTPAVSDEHFTHESPPATKLLASSDIVARLRPAAGRWPAAGVASTQHPGGLVRSSPACGHSPPPMQSTPRRVKSHSCVGTPCHAPSAGCSCVEPAADASSRPRRLAAEPPSRVAFGPWIRRRPMSGEMRGETRGETRRRPSRLPPASSARVVSPVARPGSLVGPLLTHFRGPLKTARPATGRRLGKAEA